jgi:hypothetical protein
VTDQLQLFDPDLKPELVDGPLELLRMVWRANHPTAREVAERFVYETVACTLAYGDFVLGRWWPGGPTKRSLRRIEVLRERWAREQGRKLDPKSKVDDPALLELALERLGVERRRYGRSGERWRLTQPPPLWGAEIRQPPGRPTPVERLSEAHSAPSVGRSSENEAA